MRIAAREGIQRLVMGGMHRGRLATLAVAFGKDPAILAAELVGRDLSDGATFTGDVPYHLGYRSEIDIDGNALDVSILPHPSHLIVVAPVALGYARAEARQSESDAAATLCLLAHTDAAFSGQGLSAELLQIGGLAGYTAQGSVHLVVNNQIGFTTLPSEGRSSRYCTDFAKSAGIPVLHVNGDDPIAVARAAGLAFAWRQRFSKDIIVDLVCYRRFGHNELDEPRFTQPEMWAQIDDQPSVRSKFMKTLQTSGYDFADRAARVSDDFVGRLKTGFDNAATVAPNDLSIQANGWSHMPSAAEGDILRTVVTGVPLKRLVELGNLSNVVRIVSIG
ncbi:MAG: 2-oxoglutarate dehydrogenase E1 component, partial [Hyphomicrobiales bacterium]